MTTLTDRLFVIVFSLLGVIVLNYGAAVIQFSSGHDDAGLFLLVAGLIMLVVASVELHKLAK